MIDPKELRINNAVSFVRNEKWQTRYVKEIGELGATLHEEEKLFMYSDLFPVPLTPELLEACGFEMDKADARFYKTGSEVPPLYHIMSGNYGMVSLPLNTCHIKHLHQLQNLFFALTGTELTVNLQKTKA